MSWKNLYIISAYPRQRDSRSSESLYNIDPPTLSDPRAGYNSRVAICDQLAPINVTHEADNSLNPTPRALPSTDSTRSRQMSTNLKRSTSFPVYYAPDADMINDYVALTRSKYHRRSNSLFMN